MKMQKVSRKIKIRVFFIILLITVLVTLFPTFAYGACRNELMHTKGYGVWIYKGTGLNLIFLRALFFDDGTNDLSCIAFGIGPFWVASPAFETLVGCLTKNANDELIDCPRDYFGVYP